MTAVPEQVTDCRASVLLSRDGYLRLSRQDAARFFPEDTLLVIWRHGVLYLLPTRGAAAGGLLLKQRNAVGDRSVLISEAFAFDIPEGRFPARWDDTVGGLRVSLSQGESADE